MNSCYVHLIELPSFSAHHGQSLLAQIKWRHAVMAALFGAHTVPVEAIYHKQNSACSNVLLPLNEQLLCAFD
jgi:hypothetical protein